MFPFLFLLLLLVNLMTMCDGVRTPGVWSLVLEVTLILFIVDAAVRARRIVRRRFVYRLAGFASEGRRISYSSRLRTARHSGFDDDIVVLANGTEARCSFGFDSCANVHYVGDRRLLHNYRSQSGVTIDGIGGSARVLGVGDLHLTLRSADGKAYTVIVPDVFHVSGDDGNAANILSLILFSKQCTTRAVKSVVYNNEGAWLFVYSTC